MWVNERFLARSAQHGERGVKDDGGLGRGVHILVGIAVGYGTDGLGKTTTHSGH